VNAESGRSGAGDGTPDHDVGAVLRIRPFRRLWLALGLSSFGDWLGLLATAALAKNLATDSYTAQNFAIAGVFILRLAPAVLLGPLAGALADRLERRWTLVLGDLLRFGLFASIPLVGSLSWLYVATILTEIVALFWMPAKDATVPNLVPRRRLEAANQVSLAVTYGSAPIAALCYGLLALACDAVNAVVARPVVDPVAIALFIDASTFLIAALVVWRLEIPPMPVPRGSQPGVLRSILDGWRFVGRTPVVRGLVVGMLGAFGAAGFVIGLSQTYVSDLGAGQPGFAVLFGAVFVGLALGMWAGPRLLVDFSRRRLFGLSLTLSGVFLTLLALVPNLVAAALFVVVVGAGGGVAWVTGYTLLGLEVDDEVRGRTFGFLQSAARIVLVLVLAAGPALAAPIGTHDLRITQRIVLQYNGSAWVFLLAGVLAIVLGRAAYRQMDDRPGVPLLADLRSAWNPPAGDEEVAPGFPGAAGRGYPGLFIAFEGGDGSGKSTQADLLATWLAEDQGHDVVLTREPGATQVGLQLRQLLLGHKTELGPRAEALLFAADRAHHVATVVRPALERGDVVVTDRYIDSSIAYQGAGRELQADDIARMSRWATEGLRPDLVVLLDLPIEIQRVRRKAARAADDRMEALDDAFHQRVRERFLDLARRDPRRYLVADASEPRDAIQDVIRRRVRDLAPISQRRRGELQARLDEEETARQRRAAAEVEVRALDAALRARQKATTQARDAARDQARAVAAETVSRQRAEVLAREVARVSVADAEARRQAAGPVATTGPEDVPQDEAQVAPQAERQPARAQEPAE